MFRLSWRSLNQALFDVEITSTATGDRTLHQQKVLFLIKLHHLEIHGLTGNISEVPRSLFAFGHTAGVSVHSRTTYKANTLTTVRLVACGVSMPFDVTGKAAPLAHPAYIDTANSLENPDPDEVTEIDLGSRLELFRRLFLRLRTRPGFLRAWQTAERLPGWLPLAQMLAVLS